MKVLIADDSNIERHKLQVTIARWGYEPVVASDGNQAWDLLQSPEPPRLAVLDWDMPGLTGVEVCRRLRERGAEPYVYVLLLTSKSLKEDLVEGMQAGADDYVTKPFHGQELEVRLRAGSRIIGLQDELLAAREALREQATRDELTHLWNRRSILETLERELARSQREKTHLGLLMVDLDHFKSINDTYGHAAGDAVLIEVAHRMVSSVRPYDAVGRYGGEEFLIVLAGCGPGGAMSQAERLRGLIVGGPIRIPDGRTLHVSASFGAASCHGTGRPAPADLIQLADEALYLAKRKGRDRCEFLTVDVCEGVSEQRPLAL